MAWPNRTDLMSIPWWVWVSGGLQAATIFAVFVTAGKAGGAFFSALTITGGAIASVLLDQYGLVGFDQHSISWRWIVAAMLLVAGTLLMSH
ncbi:MAG: DMT family transporter [Acetobacteraceae bacterium]|nr:DMT family transporter [Acetobacteraceae bacterium]